MSQLIMTLIQSDLVWENKEENLAHFDQIFKEIPIQTHVVVLPETFNTGFSQQPDLLAEKMDGPTMTWLKSWSHKLKKIITGSLLIKEDNKFYNRLIWMQPDGNYYYYDKHHLFGFAGEDKVMSAGTKRVIVQVNGWKINLQVCYDLRFPVWARQQSDALLYDMILYVANWPDRRIHAWDILLQARAIENQSYVVAVNRIGLDGNQVSHSGHSAIIDPMGAVIWQQLDEAAIYTHTFDKEQLDSIRKKLPFLQDRDQFIIQ